MYVLVRLHISKMNEFRIMASAWKYVTLIHL